MTVTVASAHLADDDFLAAINDATLPASSFRHGDHLRLAWLLLHRYPVPQALSEVRTSILRLAEAFNAEGLFHETITCAWVKLIATHKEATFSEFLEVNQQRLSLELLHRFWSPDLLQSDLARRTWVAPDIGDHSAFHGSR